MPRAVCEECGYDLSGLGDGEEFRCPECGAPCYPVGGFLLAPPPPPWWVVLRLLAPGVLYALFVGAALRAPFGRTAVFAAWPLLIGFWVMLGIGLPLDFARSLADRTRIRPERRRYVLALTLSATGINFLLIFLAIRLAL